MNLDLHTGPLAGENQVLDEIQHKLFMEVTAPTQSTGAFSAAGADAASMHIRLN